MKLVLKTLDGLIIVKNCPDVEEGASVVMSPLWRQPPTPAGEQPEDFGKYRRYERTGEIHEGLPVFAERW